MSFFTSARAFAVRSALRRIAQAAALSAGLLLPGVAAAQSVTFYHSGGAQTYTVPANVYRLRVSADGAAGAGYYSSPSLGGHIEANVSVTPGEVLTVYVGGQPTSSYNGSPTSAGFNGGGSGDDSNYTGGGGGATDLRRAASTEATGDYDSNRNALLVAGGGGGDGYDGYYTGGYLPGGAGGQPDGSSGSGAYPGEGATQAGPGGSSSAPGYNGYGGSGSYGGGGGGGGGGYSGGGGGTYSSGGGGSSWVMPTGSSNVAYSLADYATDGQLTITPDGPLVVRTRNVSVTLDVNGNATVTAAAVNNGSTINGSPAGASTLSVAPGVFSCADLTAPYVARALSLSGSTQYVAVAGPATVPVGNSSYTLEAWIKPTVTGSYIYGIVSWGSSSTSNQTNALRLVSTAVNAANLTSYWRNNDLTKPVGNLAGAWHHVATTYDQGTNTRLLYLDGQLVGQDRPAAGHAVPNASNLRIGSTNNGEFFRGGIDEVRVWNVARTAAQIASARGIVQPAGTANLVAYYRFGEGSGTTTADANGTAANQGTLIGNPTWTTDAAPVGSSVALTLTDAGGSSITASALVQVDAPAAQATTTWRGTASTDLLACQNWSYGQLPTATTNVLIPASQPRYPTLSTGTLAAKDLTIASGASLATSSGATLQVSGDFLDNGTTTLAGPVQLLGSAATQLLSSSSNFAALVVNKPAGTVQLGRDLNMAGALALASGTLTTGSYQVALGSAASLSETETSYVLGKVAVSRTLAPGTAEPFAGLGLTLTPAAGSTAPGVTLVTRSTGTALSGVGTSSSILRYYDVVPAVNTGLNVAMAFAYFDHELNGIPAANLLLFKSESSTNGPWMQQRPAALGSNVVTKTGIADFSVWTLGNAANPLPVELAAFTATLTGPTAVRLAWATASEKNSAAFGVERSTEGSHFARIATVAAAGSSSAARSYELTDAKLPTGAATLYYRLRQVDADGTFAYSPVRTVRTVSLGGAAAGLALYPNPARGGAATLTGALPGTAVTVVDALGRPVLSATADASGTAALVLPAGTPTGVYVVRAGARAVRLVVE